MIRPFEFFEEARRRHGDIYSLRVGRLRPVVLNHPRHIQHVLREQDVEEQRRGLLTQRQRGTGQLVGQCIQLFVDDDRELRIRRMQRGIALDDRDKLLGGIVSGLEQRGAQSGLLRFVTQSGQLCQDVLFRRKVNVQRPRLKLALRRQRSHRGSMEASLRKQSQRRHKNPSRCAFRPRSAGQKVTRWSLGALSLKTRIGGRPHGFLMNDRSPR